MKRVPLRLRRAAVRYLVSKGTDEACLILESRERLNAFCLRCYELQASEATGPIADAIGKLIQSFLDDPQRWIAVIQLVISLFASTNQGEES